jgi:hypothetical protein
MALRLPLGRLAVIETWIARLVLAVAAVAAGPLHAADASPPRNECDVFYGPTWKPLRGMVPATAEPRALPPKGQPFRDSAHGTCVVRVTDHDKEAPVGYARNDYSRRQPFNADDSRLIVVAQDGRWHLYDANTYAHLEVLAGLSGAAEPYWDPVDPGLLYYLPRDGVGMKMLERDVRSGSTRTVADFADRLKARWPKAQALWTKGEGSPSADGRYWCFMIDDTAWQGVGLITWDKQTDTILGWRDLNGDRPDHVSMSPSGSYCVVSGDSKGTTAFSRDLSQSRLLRKGTEHSDIALDAAGNDVYVSVDYDANGGPVFMTNLRSGERTDLFPTYLDGTTMALHFSGKSFRKPGWVLVSSYAESPPRSAGRAPWPHGRVFALELRKDPTVLALVHHRSRYKDYWTAPVAAVNRDFSRVLFNSNWGAENPLDVNTFMVVIPPATIARGR